MSACKPVLTPWAHTIARVQKILKLTQRIPETANVSIIEDFVRSDSHIVCLSHTEFFLNY